MKHLKRWLALLVSAALALTLLAGCGSGSIQRNSLVQLLSGQLENVQVTGDAAFDRALKTAVRQGGSDPEAVLSALAEELGISAPLSFSISALSGGKAGQQSLDVVFQPGSDPDTAANNAASGWLPTLRGLGSSGKYSARVSLAETDGGCILAIEVTVVQPGSSEENTGEDSEDGSSQPEDPGYTVSGNTYTVTSADGLKNIAKLVNEEGKTNIDITLDNDIDLTGEWTPIGTESQPYTGTFDGNDCTITGLKITGSNRYAGLFGQINPGGTVKNVVLTGVNITSGTFVGGVAGWSFGGKIENCSVSGSVSGSSGSDVGGVVGYQQVGSITGCSSSATVKGTERAGGVVGVTNGGTTPLTACYATGNVTVENDGTSNAWAGGIVGMHGTGTLIACYATGNVSGNIVGGAVGVNYATVTACYWSGSPDNDNGGATKVDDTTVTWQMAVDAMNTALSGAGCAYKYQNGNPPTLTKP